MLYLLVELTAGAVIWTIKSTVTGIYHYVYPVKTAEDYEKEILEQLNQIKQENDELKHLIQTKVLKLEDYEIIDKKEIN